MNLQIILETQLTGGSTTANVILLLVAAIIGFIIGYLLCRSKIRKTETHQAGLDALKSENIRLKGELESSRNALQKMKAEKENVPQEVTETREKVSKSEDDLSRVAAKKHLLNYDSFGTASESEKDDLKKINGIGPYIEKKLNALDIYTFEQISRFSDKDIKSVTESIEFFPGRIVRDRWAEQARELIKRG